jgi:hypothetical protein
MNLNIYQHIFIVGLSLIWSLLFVHLIMPGLQKFGDDFQPLLFLLITFFGGPGTWGILLLYGKNILKYWNWSKWMTIYNFTTFFLVIAIQMILVVIEMSKFFQQNP